MGDVHVGWLTGFSGRALTETGVRIFRVKEHHAPLAHVDDYGKFGVDSASASIGSIEFVVTSKRKLIDHFEMAEGAVRMDSDTHLAAVADRYDFPYYAVREVRMDRPVTEFSWRVLTVDLGLFETIFDWENFLPIDTETDPYVVKRRAERGDDYLFGAKADHVWIDEATDFPIKIDGDMITFGTVSATKLDGVDISTLLKTKVSDDVYKEALTFEKVDELRRSLEKTEISRLRDWEDAMLKTKYERFPDRPSILDDMTFMKPMVGGPRWGKSKAMTDMVKTFDSSSWTGMKK